MHNDLKKEMISQGTVIDVRTYDEVEEDGVFGDAVHIPLDEILDRVDDLNEMKSPLVLYCRSGNRSGHAKTLLESEGVSSLYNGINKDYLETLSKS